MRRSPCFAALAISGIALSAAPTQPAPPLKIFGPSTFGMDACSADDSKLKNIGVIRIRMPKRLNFSSLERRVKYEFKPGGYNDPKGGDGQDDAGGKPNDRLSPQPFDIYLKSILADTGYTPGPNKQYILVRVIIRDASNYAFYEGIDINEKIILGVGRSPSAHGVGDGVLCGSRPIQTPSDNSAKDAEPRKVASFFIDVAAFLALPLRTNVGFNIGIVPESGADTPIFIDPKIHNEG